MNLDIKFYWELVKTRLPIMIVIFGLCAGVGVGLAFTMPPKYQASAALLVEGAELPDSLITSTVQSQASKELEAIELRLKTRAHLIEIAEKLGVFADDPDKSPDEIVAAMRERTGFRLSSGRDRATTLRISFEAADPQVAAEVVNEFVTFVLQADIERRTDESGQTLDFFIERVERLDERLAEQSAEIVAFKEANNDALPDGLEFRLNRQSKLQERLSLAARDRLSLLEQKNRLVLVGEDKDGSQMTRRKQEIDRLETELRSKLVIYAPDSQTIDFLRKRIEILKSNAPLTDADSDDDGMSVVLKLQMAEVESRIDALDEEVRIVEQELNDLNQAIDRTPQVSIALDALERDYETTLSQHNEAVRARSAAEQGVDVEAAAKGERVTLIEPATVPGLPKSPNRKLVAGGGVFVGSALAALFFVLSELVNSAVRRPVDIVRGLGVQPLATIPYLEEGSVRRRRRIAKTVFSLSALMAISAALWALHSYVMPLDLLYERALDRVGL